MKTKTHILLFSYDVARKNSGSGRALFNLYDALKNKYTTEVDIVYTTSLNDDNINTFFVNDSSEHKASLPDIIISQQWATFTAKKYSQKYKIPLIVYIHGPGQYEQNFTKKDTFYSGFPECFLLLTCSTKEKENVLLYDSNIDMHVQCPIINLSEILVKNPSTTDKKYITMVCSKPYLKIKGFDIFLKIAHKLPQYEFMVVGDVAKSDTNEFNIECDNIFFKGIVHNMADVYSQTKILLMPSRQESFGIVCKEATLNQIPVIAADLPGIRESSYGLARLVQLDKLENEDLWIDQINQIINNTDTNKKNIALDKYIIELENNTKTIFDKIHQVILSSKKYIMENNEINKINKTISINPSKGDTGHIVDSSSGMQLINNDKVNKFCFVAIVRTESHVIKRCIDSFSNIATSYLICDTGSTDNTPKIIEEYTAEKNIPGEVIHKSWKNYGHNKSYLLDQAYTHNKSRNAKYIIWHDADEVFVTNPDDPLSYLTKQDADNLYNWLESKPQSIFYIKTIHSQLIYKRWNIVRNNQLYQWISPKHEWLKGTVDNTSTFCDKFILYYRQEGNASRDPMRCQKDVGLYLEYISENGGPEKCGREVFYLAREYESFNKKKSIKYHKMKINLPGQWEQEIYISYLSLGRICSDEYHKIKYWKAGFKLIPKRLECIHEIVKYYMSKSKFDYALKSACLASENRNINIDDLFVESNVYHYAFDLDYSVSAHLNGQNELANIINQKNMIRNKGKPIMGQLITNQKFINQKIIDNNLMKLTIQTNDLDMPRRLRDTYVQSTINNSSRSTDIRPTVIIVDDFYEDPDKIRKIALSENYNVIGNYPGGRTKSFATDEIKKRFEMIVGKQIVYWPDEYNGAYQITNKDHKSWIHRDETNYSAIIYLTPNAPPNSGTVLYKHKASGLRYTSNSDEDSLLDSNSQNMDAWEQLDVIGNVYNRCIIFNGKHSHKSNVYFGDTKENSRLFQTFFFDTVN